MAGITLGPAGLDLVEPKTAAAIGFWVFGAGVAAIETKIDSEKKNMPDVVCGYIAYELEKKKNLVHHQEPNSFYCMKKRSFILDIKIKISQLYIQIF